MSGHNGQGCGLESHWCHKNHRLNPEWIIFKEGHLSNDNMWSYKQSMHTTMHNIQIHTHPIQTQGFLEESSAERYLQPDRCRSTAQDSFCQVVQLTLILAPPSQFLAWDLKLRCNCIGVYPPELAICSPKLVFAEKSGKSRQKVSLHIQVANI